MIDETIFRMLTGAFLVCGISISKYYRQRANRACGRISRRVDDPKVLLLQIFIGLPFMLSMLVLLIKPSWMNWSRLEIPDALRWSGVPIALLVLAGLPWLFRHLGNNITPTASTRQEAQLVITGPYRFIRHPLYTFGSFLWIGVGLMMASWLILLFAVFAFCLMAWRAPSEEAALIEKFGDQYQSYMDRTPRYLPWPWTLHPTH